VPPLLLTGTHPHECFDVAVAGLGPTGAALACLLGQRGLSVIAFDKLPDLYPLPRAIGLDHEVMRVLQELGTVEAVLAHAAPYRPSEYRGVDGALIKRLDMAPPPHAMGWAPNYVFNQPAFERALRARLAQLPSVETHLSTELLSFDAAADAVTLEVRHPHAVERHAARYLIGCDGGASPVRKRLGIPLNDLGFDEPWLVVDAQVRDDVLDRLPSTQVQYCEPQRPCTYVVGPGRHRRWELMVMPGDRLSNPVTGDELWQLLSRWIRPGEAELWRAATYRFHGLVAAEWRRGRVLLAGDSAHMTPPFMAQGMVAGIRDAHNLAWKLERVVRGTSGDALLDSYGAERRPHAEQLVHTAIALGRVICEQDPAAAAARDAALLQEQGGVVKTTVRQSMTPSLADGVVATGSPGAGTLFPQPWVARGPDSPVRLDDLTGAVVRVVSAQPLTDGELAALVSRAAALQGCVVTLVPGAAGVCAAGAWQVDETAPLLQAWLEAHGARFAIVRPDHCVFGTAATLDDLQALLARFEAVLAGR
jgi:3-(3-hydroxy-phenyl)propionate hydroxylase